MSTAYWNQWSHAEILSMHGIELDEVDTDLEHDESDTDLYQEDCCCFSGCMKCLDLSSRDFM